MGTNSTRSTDDSIVCSSAGGHQYGLHCEAAKTETEQKVPGMDRPRRCTPHGSTRSGFDVDSSRSGGSRACVAVLSCGGDMMACSPSLAWQELTSAWRSCGGLDYWFTCSTDHAIPKCLCQPRTGDYSHCHVLANDNDNASTWARAPRYNVHLLATASRLLRGVALLYLRLHHLQRRVAP